MYCSDCGVDIGSAKYCSSCGSASPSAGAFGSPPATKIPDLPPPPNYSAVGVKTDYTSPSVSFGQAISAGFRGYVVWNARSTRAEYWWWTLFNFLVLVGALLIDSVATGGLLYLLAVFGLLLPNLSVLIRRLHDTDKHGGWFWISLIPLVGAIILLVFTLTPSTPGPTRWNRNLVVER